jgi:hypothetical protein
MKLKRQHPIHNIKQLGFSGLRAFGSRSKFFQRWIGTQPENPTVSYCQPLWLITEKQTQHQILQNGI